MEGGTAEREQARGRRGRGTSRLKDQLSFGATLLSVAAIAISIGWMIGQYAIQTVTGPRIVADNFERPDVVADVSEVGAAPAVGSASSIGSPASPGVADSPRPSGSAGVTSGSAASSGTGGSAPATGGFWRVQAGAFSDKSRADSVVADLRAKGFDAAVVLGADPVPYRVQVGAFREESRARAVVDDLRAAGFEAALFAPAN